MLSTDYELEGRAALMNLPVGPAGAMERVLVCVHQSDGATLVVLNDAGGIVTSLAIFGDISENLPRQLAFREVGEFAPLSRSQAGLLLGSLGAGKHGPLTIARATLALGKGVSHVAALEHAVSVSRACSALANSLPGLIQMRGLNDHAINNVGYQLAAA